MRRSIIVIVFLALCGAAACSDSDSSPPPTPAPTAVAQARYLFLLYSDAGELTAKADGSYVFKMKQVWNTVVAFADRPFRDATSTPLNTWVDNWTVSGFAKNPPNAALTMLVHGSVQITDWAIMTLSNPRFVSATELDFDATFLTLPNGEMAFFPDEPGTGVKPSFFTTQVFIDSTGAVTAPEPTPTLRPCQPGNEVTNCTAAFCGDPGKGGCCTAASPFGCFDPSAVYPASNWIGYTLCGQPDKRALACVLGGGPAPTPTPTQPTNPPTNTPVPGAPTSTPTNTPSGSSPTPTNTVPAGTIRRCSPADPGGKACSTGQFKRCTSDADCGANGPCVANVGGCLRDCKNKYCCTASGGCLDSLSDCQFSGIFPNGCYGSDNQCRNDVLCDAHDVPPPSPALHKITITNSTDQMIWVAGLGSNPGPIDIGSWNWELPAGASHTVTVPYGWDSGRFWPRTGCTPGAAANDLTCETGDCQGKRTCEVSGEPPAILAELTVDGGTNKGQPDNYNASAVDGWNNIVVTIQPTVAGSFPGQWCGTAGCTSTPACPTGYTAKYEKNGNVLGCLSPCKAPGTDPATALILCCTCSNSEKCTCGESCCSGKFGCSPYYPTGQPNPMDQLCIPTGTTTRDDGQMLSRPASKWDDRYLTYIDNFHAACGRTYAWQFDDLSNLFKCEATPGTVLDYTVTFHTAKGQ